MAGARIRVEQGPDEGLEVALCAAEVRLGRGAAASVPLTDQGVMGALRVWFDGTQYLASNEIDSTTGHPAELRAETEDGREFPLEPRAQGPWFAGFRIWLTEQTCLVLTVDPALDLDDGRFEVTRSRPSAAEKKRKDLVTIALIVVLFGAAGVIFMQEPPQEAAAGRADREIGPQFRRLDARLRAARDEAKDHPKARAAATVHGLLREGRFAEVQGRRAAAAERYAAAREELNRELGAPDAAPPDKPPPDPPPAALVEALTEAREFVADRLVALKDVVARDRPNR